MEIKEIMEMTESDRIRTYISRYKTAIDASPATKRARKKRTAEYIVKLSSGLDAVIEKKEKTGDKLLVLMPSQNKYMFKQGEVVQDIHTTSKEDFVTYFKAMPEEGVDVNNIVIGKITAENVGSLYDMIMSKGDELHEGLMSLSLFISNLEGFLKKDKKMYKLIVTKTPILSNSDKYGHDFIDMAFAFNEIRGYDAARVFVEEYTKSSMKGINVHAYGGWRCGRFYSYREASDARRVISEKSLDTKTLIQYLCFGLYAQGFDTIPIVTYRDYIQMSMEYEDRIRDKYPAALLTAHDVASLKYQMHKTEIDKKNFMRGYDDFKSIYELESNTVFQYKDISLVIPATPNDLIDEGQKLGHCVGSYVSRVASGECIILFGRRSEDMEHSYLTVELRPFNEFGKKNFSIAQIQGDMKRTKLTDEEKNFFIKLMDKMNFKTTNGNFEGKYRA